MNNFLNFKTFIAPALIKWYWLLSTVILLISGIQRIVVGIKNFNYSEGVYVWQGIAIAIAGPLLNRIICEVLLSIVERRDK